MPGYNLVLVATTGGPHTCQHFFIFDKKMDDIMPKMAFKRVGTMLDILSQQCYEEDRSTPRPAPGPACAAESLVTTAAYL